MLETKNITRKDLIEKLLKMKTTSTQPISTPADRPMISKEEQYNKQKTETARKIKIAKEQAAVAATAELTRKSE